MNVMLSVPCIFSKFFKRLSKGLSRKMQGVLLYYVGTMYLEHKRFSLSSVSQKAPNINYQKVQYFLSEAKWDEVEYNNERIEKLQELKQTKSTKEGVLIIDDTSNKKGKNCKATDTVAKQYSSEHEGIINCQTSVYSTYADIKKAWPIDLKPYWPEKTLTPQIIFKSKLELACELVDEAIQRGIKFSHLVFDNWYLSNEMIRFCENREKRFISEVDVNRWILWRGRWIKSGELVKLAQKKTIILKPATVSDKKYLYYEFRGRFKGVDVALRFVITACYDEDGKMSYKVLVSNDLKTPAHKVIQKYSLRWKTEVCFQLLKDCFYLDQFQVRSVRSFVRHYYLCISAYSFVLTHLMCGSLKKFSPSTPKTFQQAITVIRDIITVESFPKLNGNVHLLLTNKNLHLAKIPA